MNPLQRKCFIVSAGFHLLLALILLVGPAFFSQKIKSEDLLLLDIIPATVVDSALNRAGASTAKLPPPPPSAPAPQVTRSAPKAPPEKVPEPDPPKDLVKQEDSLEPAPKKNKIQISTKPVVRNATSRTASKQPSEADDKARELADARQRNVDLLKNAARSLRQDFSPSKEIEMPGPGFGEAVASYAQVVKSIYEHAWLPPDDTASDDAITKVTVTISNTGKVLSSHILRASGDGSVDRSVQRTLDRVDFVQPFPPGAKDKERTYTINFNLKARRALASN